MGGERLVDLVGDGDHGVRGERRAPGGEPTGAAYVLVVEGDLGDRGQRGAQEPQHLEVDDAAADEGDAGRGGLAREQPCGEGSARRGALRGDPRALDQRQRPAGAGVVEHDDGAGPLQAQLQIAGERGDPLHSGGGALAAEVAGQADDAVARRVGEAQEDGVRQGRVPLVVQPVRGVHGVDGALLGALQDVLDIRMTDDQHAVGSISGPDFHRCDISPKFRRTHASE